MRRSTPPAKVERLKVRALVPDVAQTRYAVGGIPQPFIIGCNGRTTALRMDDLEGEALPGVAVVPAGVKGRSGVLAKANHNAMK